MDRPLIFAVFLFHDVAATALLLLISWQAFAAWSSHNVTGSLGPAFRAIPLELRDMVLVLFVIVIGLGGALYPAYRFTVRPYLEANSMHSANGAFEIKEQFAALSLLMMPAYRAAWRKRTLGDTIIARRAITGLLCAMVWWNFMVGHLMNLIRGIL